jgi:hypothetical protein
MVHPIRLRGIVSQVDKATGEFGPFTRLARHRTVSFWSPVPIAGVGLPVVLST